MNHIPEEKFRFGLYYIQKHKTGYVDALKKIHINLPEYFKRIGYIVYGVDAVAHIRYRTTREGLEHARVSYIAMCTQPITLATVHTNQGRCRKTRLRMCCCRIVQVLKKMGI